MFCNVIWLDEQALVATFHAVKGYVPYPLLDKPQLMRFLDSLLEKGYKFM